MAEQARAGAHQAEARDNRKRLGNAGERLAEERLRQAGYTVRMADYRCREAAKGADVSPRDQR